MIPAFLVAPIQFKGNSMRPLLGILLVVASASADAATLYVRQGASGNGSGLDWSNALSNFPSIMSSSGSIYYVADGNYSSFQVTGANVVVKKCSAADHGTDVGYQPTYCDGQASLGGDIYLQNAASGFVIDGAYRNEGNWGAGDAYGFRLSGLRSSTAANNSPTCPDSISARYLNIGVGEGATNEAANEQPFYMGGFAETCSGWTLSRSYLHNWTWYTMVQCAGCDGLVVEYSLFKNGWGKEAIRGQSTAKNMTIRFNRFEDACGYPTSTFGGQSCQGCGCTAEIAIWDGGANQFDNNKIYGNSFYRTKGRANDFNDGGTIVVGGNGSSWAGSPANNTIIYNNTIAGIQSFLHTGASILVNGGTGNVIRNTLWYDVGGTPSANANTTSNNVKVTSDPFVNYATRDLRLKGPTSPGFTLASPYNADMNGVMRASDGSWDLGAYEYLGLNLLPAPSNLRQMP